MDIIFTGENSSVSKISNPNILTKCLTEEPELLFLLNLSTVKPQFFALFWPLQIHVGISEQAQ